MNRNPDISADLLGKIQQADHAIQEAIWKAQEDSFSSGTRIENELYKLWLRFRRVAQEAARHQDMDLRREK